MKKTTLALVAVALLAISAPASAATCGGKPWTAEAFLSGECYRAGSPRFAGDGYQKTAADQAKSDAAKSEAAKTE